jgi:hypothetical protein
VVTRAAPAGRPRRARPAPAAAESGFALLVALFVVFLLSVALSLLGMSLALRLRVAHDEARATTLNALCDAAVAETLAGLAAGQAGGVDEHPFGGGSIGSQVQTLAAKHYRITATARTGGRARTVLADVVRDDQGTRVVHWQRLGG